MLPSRGLLLGQRCVEVAHETIHEVSLPAVLGVELGVLFVFSSRRMVYDVYDDFAKKPGVACRTGSGASAKPPLVPLLGATHSHRHLRGSIWSEGRMVRLASASAAYSPNFAELFARIWSCALEGGRS